MVKIKNVTRTSGKKKKTPRSAAKTAQLQSLRTPTHAVMSHAMQACSLTNPFCPEAIGARWPDNSYTKSVGYSHTAVPFTLSSDTTENSNLFLGDVYAYAQNTNASPKTSPYTYTTAVAVSGLPSNIARYRITSWGLKLSGIVAPLSASGRVRIRLFSPLTGTTLNSISGTSALADAVYDIPLARLANKDFFIIPAPLGNNARLFRDYASATGTLANWINPGWQCVQVAIDGAPASTACIQISAYYNYEFVFADGDASTYFAHPPPASNPVAQQASAGVLEKVGNFFEGTAQALDRVFQSRAAQYLIAGGMSYAAKNPTPLLLTAGAHSSRNLD